MEKSNDYYNVKLDQPDSRDALFQIRDNVPILPRVDLRMQCSPIEDQKKIGSCTANALVGVLEFLEKKNRQKLANLSRLFIYY